MPKDSVISGPWPGGLNSLADPQFLPDNQYVWSVNTINRGGMVQTRPGYNIIGDKVNAGTQPYTLEPRGFTIFTPKNGDPVLVKAVGTIIRFSLWPYGQWSTLAGVTLDPGTDPVYFETTVKGAITHDDGSLETIDPYPVLMIQTGKNRAAFWDGVIARHLDPTKTAALSETPIGTWMKWINSRLWVAQGSRLRASNVLDPLKFTEEDIAAEGGALALSGEITGLGETADLQSLLAFTSTSTTSFQTSFQRAPDPNTGQGGWQNTPGFQRVILPDIGCVAGFTVINQYGLTWWLSQGGLIGLDGALQTYRTSKIHYKDNDLSRSKGNLSSDVSRACSGAFENFLMLSWPSGDTYNYHTAIMDQGILDDLNSESPPAWSSVWIGTKPVQWASGNIKGQNRCFHLSRDNPPGGDDANFRSNVWETFCSNKFDVGWNAANNKAAKNMTCSMETKFLGKDASYKKFDSFKVKLKELSGTVHIGGWFAATHAGFKQVLSKDIIATTDELNQHQTAEEISTVLPAFIRQTRFIRSGRDEAQVSDQNQAVEDIYTRNKDTAFSILLEWSGQLGVSYIVCTYDSTEEQLASIEPNETTIRTVDPQGISAILSQSPIDHTTTSGDTSSNIVTFTPRTGETYYQSLT